MKVALIGSGNMGRVLAQHLVKHCSLTIYNRGKEKGLKIAKETGASFAASSEEAVLGADFVILAMKPKDFKGIEKTVCLKKGQTLLSILAGVSLGTLRKAFGQEPSIVRMMPNTALAVSKGIIGFSQEGFLEEKIRKEIEYLFSEIGLLLWISESRMDAFAALAASSPAFVFVLMESMIESGVYLGFSAAEARDIVLSVFEGCVALLKMSAKHPAELKTQITSPAGTTIEGLKALEEGGVRSALFNALDETYQKSLKMAKESGEKG